MTLPVGASQPTVEQVGVRLPQNRTAWLEWRQVQSGLRLVIAVVLVLGVFFRCVNIDRKVYWMDEVYTSIRIAGYATEEIIHQVFDGHLVNREDLLKYQRLNPEKSVVDTIQGLAAEEPHLAPLYFVTARFWAQCFGDSVAAIRSLSVLFSLLTFPCLYWLCRELFQSRLVAWLSVALFAVSPLQVLYAQEARPYSLWTLTVLPSSATLLWAVQKPTKLRWGAYALTVALGLYAFLFSAWFTIARGIYLLAIASFRWSKVLAGYLLAALAGLAAFAPWLWVAIADKAKHPVEIRNQEISSILKHWFGNASRIFFDLNITSAHSLPSLILLVPLILIILGLSGFAIYYLCRNTFQRVWLFVMTFIGIPTAATLAIFYKMGYQLDWIPSRYIIPVGVGIELAVAYLLGTRLACDRSRRQKQWQWVAIALFSLGIASCTVSSQAREWWNKGYGYCNPQVACIVNESSSPLIATDLDTIPNNQWDANVANVISLSYSLSAQTRFQLVRGNIPPEIGEKFSDVFLFTPSEKLREQVVKKNLQPRTDGEKSHRVPRLRYLPLEIIEAVNEDAQKAIARLFGSRQASI